MAYSIFVGISGTDHDIHKEGALRAQTFGISGTLCQRIKPISSGYQERCAGKQKNPGAGRGFRDIGNTSRDFGNAFSPDYNCLGSKSGTGLAICTIKRSGGPKSSGYQEQLAGHRERKTGTSGTIGPGLQERTAGTSGTGLVFNLLKTKGKSAYFQVVTL
jgi:hypothetical protein